MSTVPTTAESDNPIDDCVREILRRKARSLVGRAGLSSQDRPDIEQELTLRLLRPLQKYDPTRGERLAFAQTLIDRLAANILRDRQAGKRDAGPIASLDQPLGGGDLSLATSVGDREHFSMRGSAPRNDAELTDLALDVASVLESLPDNLRAIAAELMSVSLTELARRLGVPRSTLRDRLAPLRERLERGNLDEY